MNTPIMETVVLVVIIVIVAVIIALACPYGTKTGHRTEDDY